MKKSLLVAIIIPIIIAALVGIDAVDVVEANWIPAVFIDEVKSPINGTMYPSSPLLDVVAKFDYWGNRSLYVAYSVDGKEKTALNGTFEPLGNTGVEYFYGSVQLPPLAEGQHYVVVYAWVNAQDSPFGDRSSWASTIYFEINSTPVQTGPLEISVNVSSPIQNETYNTNDIPLSFSYDTNIINSPRVTNYSVVFTYTIDGQPIFDYFGNSIFTGSTTRIAQFNQPVPLTHSSSIHVPNGAHSLFVYVTFWIKPNDVYPNTFKLANVSQVINFTVSSETANSTPSKNPSSSPLPSMTQQPTINVEPTATNTPSGSPTQQPTLEPFQTTTPIVDGFQIVNYTPMIIIASIVITAVIVGLLVYLAKYKGWK